RAAGATGLERGVQCVRCGLRRASAPDFAGVGNYPGRPFFRCGCSLEASMRVSGFWGYLPPLLLLLCSNVFMTLAWYGHLNFKARPLFLVVFASWGIAFIEYCLAVPANRYGHALYSAAELKTIQEIVTLIVFAGFSALYLREPVG